MTSAETRSLCEDELQITWNDVPANGTAAPISHPGEVLQYRLYPGGKVYQATVLPDTVEDITLQPNPQTNPLGVFYHAGELRLRNNANVTGVIIVDGAPDEQDIRIDGTNVVLRGVELPTLSGSNQAIQLPFAIVDDDLFITEESTGSITGLIATWDECGFEDGGQSAAFAINGKLVVNHFYCKARNEWAREADWWRARGTEFLANLATANPTLFFSVWLQNNFSLDPQPHLVVRPDSAAPAYHWPSWNQPIFVAHPDDGGLRWDVLQVREIP
jgi:hypothetical protein